MKSEVLTQFEIEARLIYSIIVAGKSADFADKATTAFLLAARIETERKDNSPLEMFKQMTVEAIDECARRAKTGNYSKLSQCCFEISRASKLCLLTCAPAELEAFHGIGPKTSRFFIIWIRPAERYAALDVHVLRWMRSNGYPHTPKSTPSGEKYARLEREFIAEADKRGKSPRDLDYEIWMAGAGRSQQTTKVENLQTT